MQELYIKTLMLTSALIGMANGEDPRRKLEHGSCEWRVTDSVRRVEASS
jgi:hypothetical protein